MILTTYLCLESHEIINLQHILVSMFSSIPFVLTFVLASLTMLIEVDLRDFIAHWYFEKQPESP
jgi:hypothetical protein